MISRLKALRIAKGETLKTVAHEVGGFDTNWCNIERFRMVAPEYQRRAIAEYYGVSMDILFDERGLARELPIEAVLQA